MIAPSDWRRSANFWASVRRSRRHGNPSSSGCGRSSASTWTRVPAVAVNFSGSSLNRCVRSFRSPAHGVAHEAHPKRPTNDRRRQNSRRPHRVGAQRPRGSRPHRSPTATNHVGRHSVCQWTAPETIRDDIKTWQPCSLTDTIHWAPLSPATRHSSTTFYRSSLSRRIDKTLFACRNKRVFEFDSFRICGILARRTLLIGFDC